MKAINKTTGAVFNIKETKSQTFVGETIFDPTGTWKKGELNNNAAMIEHELYLEWSEYTELKVVLAYMKKVFV